MDEIVASLNEFKTDYNQTHFVRNDTFKAAADAIQGPARKIFIEFLERSVHRRILRLPAVQGAGPPPEEE